MNGGSIYGNSAALGGGIYLADGSCLNIYGDPIFQDKQNGVVLFNDGRDSTAALAADAKNGREAYTVARQDIYLVDSAQTPAAMVVEGELTGKDGSIWVWTQIEDHYQQLKPFAVLQNGVEGNLKVFRNAQPDSLTLNGTDTYLYGTKDGDTPGYVYWSGIMGTRKVILRKVNTGYDSLSGAAVDVYRGDNETPYVNALYDPALVMSAENLISGDNGVIWIGYLPYGTYQIHETVVPDDVKPHEGGWWYTLTVNEEGVTCSEQREER